MSFIVKVIKEREFDPETFDPLDTHSVLSESIASVTQGYRFTHINEVLGFTEQVLKLDSKVKVLIEKV